MLTASSPRRRKEVGRQQVDARLAEPLGGIQADRLLIDLSRRSKLNEAPMMQNADMCRHGHGFDLIMGDVKECRTELAWMFFNSTRRSARSFASSELRGSSIR